MNLIEANAIITQDEKYKISENNCLGIIKLKVMSINNQ
jgi:hypothetical protein